MLLSVVIPAYNVKDYIDNAITSLINQTIADINIILVDDGSIDSSGCICDYYSKKYNNITTVHKQNGGLASSRNAGLKFVQSDYVAFLDADDYFEAEFSKIIVSETTSFYPDCICFGWQYVTVDGVQPPQLTGLPKLQILNREFIHSRIIPRMINLNNNSDDFIFDFAWNKIYKMEIIKKNGIAFDENRRIWEDRIFVVEYLKYCDTFFCIGEPLYNYVRVEDSLSSKYYLNFFEIILDNYNKYFNWFSKEYNFDIPYSNNYWCSSIENMIFKSLDQKENHDIIKNNILKVFCNEQVAEWYRKRIPTNRFQAKTYKLISERKYIELYDEYEKMYKKRKHNKQVKNIIQKIKGRLRNILK